MKKWARLNDDNVVIEIVVESDDEDLEGPLEKNTKTGMAHHERNGLVRTLDPDEGPVGSYASVGFIYDSELKGFVPPQSDPTDVFDPKTFTWLPAKPDNEKEYYWDDSKTAWVAVEDQ